MLKYLILVSILKILESGASFHSLSASELDINGSQVNMNYMNNNKIIIFFCLNVLKEIKLILKVTMDLIGLL